MAPLISRGFDENHTDDLHPEETAGITPLALLHHGLCWQLSMRSIDLVRTRANAILRGGSGLQIVREYL